MSGNAFLLDTNTVIALLKGETSIQENIAAAIWLGISIITVIEFNSFSALMDEDRDLFQAFSSKVEIINLSSENTTLLEEIYSLRRVHLLKTPDAIIVASAKVAHAILLTRDQKLLNLGFDYIRSF
jgi:hypothetical protein